MKGLALVWFILEAQFSSKTMKSRNLNGPALSSQKAIVKLNKF